jgi:hypothetical protein
MFGGGLSRLIFRAFGLVPGKQSLKIVTVWAVASEGILVEQTLDSAGRTNLIGTTLGADRPTHLAVPAAPENHSRARQACGEQTHGPQPSTTTPHFRRLLVFFFFHCLTLREPVPSIFRFAGRSNPDVMNRANWSFPALSSAFSVGCLQSCWSASQALVIFSATRARTPT